MESGEELFDRFCMPVLFYRYQFMKTNVMPFFLEMSKLFGMTDSILTDPSILRKFGLVINTGVQSSCSMDQKHASLDDLACP